MMMSLKLWLYIRLSTFVERRMILAEAQGSVLLARRRVDLMKQTYENSKMLLQQGKTITYINKITLCCNMQNVKS